MKDRNHSILFWVPGGMPLMLHVEGSIALALKLRGIPVHMIICDGRIKACIRREATDGESPSSWHNRCPDCVNACKSFLEALQLPYSFIGDYLTPNDEILLMEKATSISWPELNDFYEDGVPVGKNIVSAIYRYFMGLPFRNLEAILPAYTFSALAVLTAFEKAKIRWEPSRIFISHGTYAEWGPVFHAAMKSGIPVTGWRSCYSPSHFFFKNLENRTYIDFARISSRSWENISAIPFDTKRQARLDHFMEGRYRNLDSFDMRNLFAPSMDDISGLRQRLSISGEKPVWAVFTHLNWDVVSDSSPMLYADFDKWVLDTIKALLPLDSVQWLIKIHPSEKEFNRDSGAEALIRNTFPELPPHIAVISCEDTTSPHDLYQIIDGGVTVYGTPGLELCLRGKPVILTGQPYYGRRGFTLDAESIDDYHRLLRNAHATPALTEAQRDLALKFAYTLFIQQQIPLPIVMNPKDRSWWSFQTDKFHTLLPGQDPFMDFICARILDGEDFIMDEGLVQIALGELSNNDDKPAFEMADYIDKIDAMIAAGDMQQADSMLAELSAQFPLHPVLQTLNAEMLYHKGEKEKSQALLHAIIKEHPNQPRCLNDLGVAFWSEGDKGKALGYFKASYQSDREFRDAVLNLGCALKEFRLNDEARKVFNEFLKKNPGDAVIGKAVLELE